MEIRVYGPGCANCQRLEANTRAALTSLGQPATITKVEDIMGITNAGVMRTPALGIGDRILVQGRVPDPRELVTILATALAAEP